MAATPIQRLRVSNNRRGLEREDGTPFFWLGDTAWELLHKRNREDIEFYLTARREQGFNVVQTVLLAEFEGVTTGNADGRLPLLTHADGRPDPARPDLRGSGTYWDHVDFAVRRAAELGIYLALLPTWGDKFNRMWGQGPEIFTPENAYAYGKWLGERYRNDPNIVWVLGGDRPLHSRRHFEIVNAMAGGLKDGDEGRHLATFHPPGWSSSSLYVHEEDWLDFNMIQSSHGDGPRRNYELVRADYAKEPAKPTLDGEPCYEDLPRGFNSDNGYFDEADVRTAAYYAVFSGAFGHTYGHHSVWSMYDGQANAFAGAHPNPDLSFLMDWRTALFRPGARQMIHLKRLMEARDAASRIPDPELLADPYSGSNYAVATRGGDYALAYSPNGAPLAIVMGRIPGSRIRAAWYDPRTGASTEIGCFAIEGTQRFAPPSAGRGNDWVLTLETADD